VQVPQAPHPVLKRFGARIRQLRVERKLSQEAFADACGIDRSYMSGIERGVRNISILHVYRLARGLRVKVADLFED
jgi:transcriptional regulator with XRE-family HTH domain